MHYQALEDGPIRLGGSGRIPYTLSPGGEPDSGKEPDGSIQNRLSPMPLVPVLAIEVAVSQTLEDANDKARKTIAGHKGVRVVFVIKPGIRRDCAQDRVLDLLLVEKWTVVGDFKRENEDPEPLVRLEDDEDGKELWKHERYHETIFIQRAASLEVRQRIISILNLSNSCLDRKKWPGY